MTTDLEKRSLINKIIRKLAENDDDYYCDGTLHSILKIIDMGDRLVDLDEVMGDSGGEFDE